MGFQVKILKNAKFAIASMSLYMMLFPSFGRAQEKLENFKAALTTISAGQWAVFVGQEAGIYRQEGLDIEIVVSETSAKAILALVAGAVDIADGSSDPVILAIANTDADIIVVASSLNKPLYQLITAKGITKMADLKGKRVGVSAVLAMDGIWMKDLLASGGLEKGDYQMVEIGGSATRFAALQSGAIVGSLLTQPYDFQSLDLGFNSVALSTQIVENLAWNAYVAKRSAIEKNPNKLLRFLRAQIRAINWLYDPRNRDRAIEILMKRTNVNRKHATQTYDLWITEEALAMGARATRKGVQNMIDALTAQGQLKKPLPVDRVLDQRYISQAAASLR